MKDIILQYLGFLNTPNLWLNTSNFKMQQWQLSNTPADLSSSENHKLRLGKLVERFVSQQLKQDDTVSILIENIQIQNEKLTIGELDCLLKKDEQAIHLEIVYKFYLYDATVGTTEIDHWIGPNRKDSLVQKLAKLEEKQLPLLYHKHTKPVLEKLDLQVAEIKQQVCFKAQLFVPFSKQNVPFKAINSSCVKGFYITQKELPQFADCQFFIPEKRDWLIDIPTHNLWQSYHTFLETLKLLLNQEKAPLCWLKKPNGETEKCFVVWW
ncbi:MAG: DUF1853 family protein [Oceanihabitans sp.]|nr:DUF1853 family protein [Oceanihabitans sp.]